MNKEKFKLTHKVLLIFLSVNLISCATQQLTNKCQKYVISGGNYPWGPVKFYQSESGQNRLYIEISKTARYIPELEVIDTEFDQPYKIDYTFDDLTHRFNVEDNHDKYLLYRDSYDSIEKNEIYITCDRYKSN
ncbi:MAG: hypothetical protein K0R94_705 [Burkholderiales bacterium]|jgi:hypothetical protein|nr:hypothetical protein [Burkholderiales bacterium]